jgi:eukaryotic-like serine/threonine-protein kinase
MVQRCRMPTKPLEPGDPVRLGRFDLLGRLGEGGQGIVYLGRGAEPGEERVAVKVLRSSADANVLQRLARELEAIHQVQPFVTARVIEASVEGDRRFVVTEFIDGPSLQERVGAQGPLNEGELQRLAVGTATALTAIHGAGVVHRDFKPANVLLGPDGPRVVDFGIARVTDATTITSGLIGTPSYVAPEQLAGERPTSAVDIFAWALTMSYAATGRLAFTADIVQAVIYRILYEEPDLSGMPPSLLPLIQECLRKDPRQRPSARDVLLRLIDPSARQQVAPQTGQQQPPVAPTARIGATAQYAAPTAYLDPAPYPVQAARSDPVVLTPGRTGPLTGPIARSGRKSLVVGGVVVLALIAGGIAFVALDSHPGHAAASTTTSLTIPAAFAGTWTGPAKQSDLAVPGIGVPDTVTFTFTAGGTTAHEVNTAPVGPACVNTLTLKAETAIRLTFREPGNAQCAAGTTTFTRRDGHLVYRWTDSVEQNAGTLRKR